MIKALEKGNPGPAFIPGSEWDLAGTYDLIHTLQPKAVVTNNHHIPPMPGEDYQVFEQDLPGENTMGGNITFISDRMLVTWNTLSAGWSYNPNDKAFKTADNLGDHLKKCVERGVFLFLNVGPMPDGRFQPEEIEILKGLGAWRRRSNV